MNTKVEIGTEYELQYWNLGGKYKMNEVSLGSDLNLTGNTNQLNASPGSGQYKKDG